jgi:hypothetical protein
MSFIPTPEKMAALGYAPDATHTVPVWQMTGYSRKVPAPRPPWFATLVVQVGPDGTIFLTRHAGQVSEPWQGYAVPTELFFEQLLQALGWPIAPDETPPA